VRAQEANEDQPSSNEAASPTQEGEPDEDDVQDHEIDNDQVGVEQDEDRDDQDKSRSSPLPHPRVRQTIQRDHPVNNILCAIEKGVTTRFHVATFCEHYSFVSSFDPFKVEDALRDPDWVVVVIPRSEKVGPKPLYVCPGCSIHMHSNNMIQMQCSIKQSNYSLHNDTWFLEMFTQMQWN
jgi:hypothetical protein